MEVEGVTVPGTRWEFLGERISLEAGLFLETVERHETPDGLVPRSLYQCN